MGCLALILMFFGVGFYALIPVQLNTAVEPLVAVVEVESASSSGIVDSLVHAYFTAPAGSEDSSTYVGGLDAILVEDINTTQVSLDIAAFEFDNPAITEAVLAAHARGVQVRVVTDNEHGLEDEASTLTELAAAGILIVNDERSALMHNKFIILDGTKLWTGSWNYTINDTYRNDNNAVTLLNPEIVDAYQREFNEMFEEGAFGPMSPADNVIDNPQAPIQVLFAPENDTFGAIQREINGAQDSVRFMVFSFTDDDTGAAMISAQNRGVSINGVFETTGSETRFSEMIPLFCNGLDVRQDGNPRTMHHKIIIIDNVTVITGSMNLSINSGQNNDENILIIRDPFVAAQFLGEFQRVWALASAPEAVDCN